MSLPRHFFAAGEKVLLSLRRAARIFLALDYDGTLVPIVSRPEQAQPDDRLLLLLDNVRSARGIRVAIISGRPVAELQSLLRLPGIFYIGVHGLQVVTPEGERQFLLSTSRTDIAIRRLLPEAKKIIDNRAGFLLEDKQHALACHFRLAAAEEVETVLQQLRQRVRAYQQRGASLEMVHGKKVAEVRPTGANKGRAAGIVLRRWGQGALPIYLGDDATDEDAFRSLAGAGITVLVADPPRPTAARYYVRHPGEVEEFLRLLLRERDPRREL